MVVCFSALQWTIVMIDQRSVLKELWSKCRDFSRIIFHSHNRSSHLGARDIALVDSDESTVPESILESSGNASVSLLGASRD